MKLKKEVTNGRRKIEREPGGKSTAQLVRYWPGGCSCPGNTHAGAPENIPELAAVDAPAQDAPAGAPGEVNVSADQIDKLMAEQRAAGCAEVEKNEPPEPEQPPTPAPEDKAAEDKGPAKEGKTTGEKAPEPEKPKCSATTFLRSNSNVCPRHLLATRGISSQYNQHPHMALIQPSHDPVLGALGTVSSRAALAYATPSIDLTSTIVHSNQLAQHPYRIPLRALDPGLVGLGTVVGWIQQLK